MCECVERSPCCKIQRTNRSFWVEKIRRNQERDRRNCELLRQNGWQVVTVWECQLTPARLEQTMRRVELLLNDNLLSLYRKHTPASYPTGDEEPLPMAAEDDTLKFGVRRSKFEDTP